MYSIYSVAPEGWKSPIGILCNKEILPWKLIDVRHLIEDEKWVLFLYTGTNSGFYRRIEDVAIPVYGKEHADRLIDIQSLKYVGDQSELKTAIRNVVRKTWDVKVKEQDTFFINNLGGSGGGLFGFKVGRSTDCRYMGRIARNTDILDEDKRYYTVSTITGWGSENPTVLHDGVSLKEARALVRKLQNRETFVDVMSYALMCKLANFILVEARKTIYWDNDIFIKEID